MDWTLGLYQENALKRSGLAFAVNGRNKIARFLWAGAQLFSSGDNKQGNEWDSQRVLSIKGQSQWALLTPPDSPHSRVVVATILVSSPTHNRPSIKHLRCSFIWATEINPQPVAPPFPTSSINWTSRRRWSKSKSIALLIDWQLIRHFPIPSTTSPRWTHLTLADGVCCKNRCSVANHHYV